MFRVQAATCDGNYFLLCQRILLYYYIIIAIPSLVTVHQH